MNNSIFLIEPKKHFLKKQYCKTTIRTRIVIGSCKKVEALLCRIPKIFVLARQTLKKKLAPGLAGLFLSAVPTALHINVIS